MAVLRRHARGCDVSLRCKRYQDRVAALLLVLYCRTRKRATGAIAITRNRNIFRTTESVLLSAQRRS